MRYAMNSRVVFILWCLAGFTACALAFASCLAEKDIPSPPQDLDERNRELLAVEKELKKLESADANEASLALLQADYRIRERAARRLGALGMSAAAALDSLVRALSDKEKSVRVEAAAALGEIKDPRAAMPLIRSLVDPEPKVRMWAWKSIRKLGEPGISALIPYFKENEIGENLYYKDEAGRKKTLRKEIIFRFPTIGKAAIPVFITVLDSDDSDLRQAVLLVLNTMKFGKIEMLPKLCAVLQKSTNTPERIQIVKAIVEIGNFDPSVESALEAAAKSEDNALAQEAKNALEKIRVEKDQGPRRSKGVPGQSKDTVLKKSR